MIYLDYSANTPVDEAVLQRFCEVERNCPGNANSRPRIIDCAALHFSFPGGIIVPKFQGHCRFADGGASFFGLRVL